MEKQESSSSHGFSGFMDDLKEKFSDTKLQEAKIALIHKKYVIVFVPRVRGPSYAS
jgi:hypothetical protein